MINIDQFIEYILRPTLKAINKYSESAEILLLGTIATESHFEYIHQINGPALGLPQMEEYTHNDIWFNFLRYEESLSNKILACCNFKGMPKAEEMMSNLKYATIMARMQYFRVKEPLPPANDLFLLATYYKKYYNTYKGKGSVSKFITDYKKYIGK